MNLNNYFIVFKIILLNEHFARGHHSVLLAQRESLLISRGLLASSRGFCLALDCPPKEAKVFCLAFQNPPEAF
jgi:hypothetical protein